MNGSLQLQPLQPAGLAFIDWVIIGGYLLVALIVGAFVSRRAQTSKESYFLAGRTLPWWWAGASIAATTFAADTPLAITGIVATKGMSGNWIWLSWIGVHAAVAAYFARRWNKSGVITDAELISVRYSGRAAVWLRWVRSLLYGVVYNCIILGWVLRAMVKIVTPFFRWESWTPGLVAAVATVWPQGSQLGTPAEGLTVISLIAIVAVYSTLGGIRGVILTDLLQLGIALAGSIWLATAAWSATGGQAQVATKLAMHYGADHDYLSLFPAMTFSFGLYLCVQSYANVPADGGGYLMQRLNSTKNDEHARRAALLFIVLQYVVRTVPWFVVAVCALVLIPIGQEAAVGAPMVASDREMAYPVLMSALLPPVALGLMVTSLLAAFMSTVDTHLNWGASYIVNDVYGTLKPNASASSQVRVARLTVASFALIAILVSFRIDRIEQAWQWVAALGAALGLPTMLRWVWWRVNAVGELCAMATGLLTSLVLPQSVPFETSLVIIACSSTAGLAAGMFFGPATDETTLRNFVDRVDPLGLWPGEPWRKKDIPQAVLRWGAIAGGVIALIVSTFNFVFFDAGFTTTALFAAGATAFAWGGSRGV